MSSQSTSLLPSSSAVRNELNAKISDARSRIDNPYTTSYSQFEQRNFIDQIDDLFNRYKELLSDSESDTIARKITRLKRDRPSRCEKYFLRKICCCLYHDNGDDSSSSSHHSCVPIQ